MARISQLTNIAPVKLYAWLPLSFFGPLLFIVSTDFLDKYSQKKRSFNSLIFRIIAVMALFRLMYALGFPLVDTFIASESYLLSLIIIFSVLNIISDLFLDKSNQFKILSVLAIAFGCYASVASKFSMFPIALSLLFFVLISLFFDKTFRLTSFWRYSLLTLCTISIIFIFQEMLLATRGAPPRRTFSLFFILILIPHFLI